MITYSHPVEPVAPGSFTTTETSRQSMPFRVLENIDNDSDTRVFRLELRHYSTRDVVSLSLARTQRILELHQRITIRLRALPEADWQRAQNLGIAKRAELTRVIRELELKMIKASGFSAFWNLKLKLHAATDALGLFDRNMEAVNASAKPVSDMEFCSGI